MKDKHLAEMIEEIRKEKIRVIGLAGKARTGKSTIATALSDGGAYRHQPLAFASFLKRAIEGALGMPQYKLNNDTLKPQKVPGFDLTYRDIMQLMGTEVCRSIDPNFWVKGVANSMLKLRYQIGQKDFVISDVRFENEAEFVRAVGGKVVHVVRDDAEPIGDHSSEEGVKNLYGDWTILNNGTEEELIEASIRLVAYVHMLEGTITINQREDKEFPPPQATINPSKGTRAVETPKNQQGLRAAARAAVWQPTLVSVPVPPALSGAYSFSIIECRHSVEIRKPYAED